MIILRQSLELSPPAGDSLNFAALGIQAIDLQQLEEDISVAEVEHAIKELPSDRAPGPDGFTGLFYKKSWSFIKNELFAAVKAFSDGDFRGLDRLNSALIVLLPKILGASSPADYRPISMIHSFAKLISKILALRLAPKLHDLVDKNQNAFIRARTIHDNFKYVQRAAALIRKKKIPMLLLKLDISKAFDMLSWPFLLELLQARGFGPKWQRWIAAILSTATSRILLNGRQGPSIKHLRGVRQGDSLLPLLFILAMDVLHRLLAKASADGVLRPLQAHGVKFQCSLYADDVILFIKPIVQEAMAVKEILKIFEDASRLQTNLAKCSVTPIFGGEETMQDIVQILGCQLTEFPIRYLGLPLSTKKIPKANFHSLVESIARRLPPCHGSLVARSGRLIWIKSVLRAIPIYSMMAENLPQWARSEIDSICNLQEVPLGWKGCCSARKMHGSLEGLLQADGLWRSWDHQPQACWDCFTDSLTLAL